jgi:tRNA A-37 threonylcarbamoyl transferase component Bud32
MSRIGPYEIVEEIGRGGMGVVYRAVDPVIGRSVAIKTIRLDSLTDPNEKARLRERLFREARSAGLLSHPHIVTIYQIAEQADLAYIAMEFVRGPNLDQVLTRAKPLEQDALLEVVRQIAAALDYAHSKGIVHRDIKPGNILFSETGDVKITDFGIAKLSQTERLTRTGLVIGTPPYMSPEQIQDKAVDGRADQFSLGVMAFAMLTGVEPFDAESVTAIYFKIVYEEPRPVLELNPTLSAVIDTVLRKALAKDPSARFRTCTEFWRTLAGACAAAQGWRPMTLRGRALADLSVDQPAEAPLPPPVDRAAVQQCPGCQAELPAGLLYCGYCGVSLKEAAARAEEMRRAEEDRSRVEAEQKLADEKRRAEGELRRVAEELRRAAEERKRAEEGRRKLAAEQRPAEDELPAEQERKRAEAERRAAAAEGRILAEQERRRERERKRAEDEKRTIEEAEHKAAEARRIEEEQRRAEAEAWNQMALEEQARLTTLERLRAQGAQAFDRGEYALACAAWGEASKLSPEDPELKQWIARSMAQRQYQDQRLQAGTVPAEPPPPTAAQPAPARRDPAPSANTQPPASLPPVRAVKPPRNVRRWLPVLVPSLICAAWLAYSIFPTAPPEIRTFAVNPPSVQGGQPARLVWGVAHAGRVSIEPDIGEVTPSGERTVVPGQSTTFHLKADGPRGKDVTASATVTVTAARVQPQIRSFAIVPRSVRPGETARLVWDVARADRVFIEPDIGSVNMRGAKTIRPDRSITFRLKATGPDCAETTEEVQVALVAVGSPQIRIFTVTPPSLAAGQTARLFWDVAGADRVSIDPDIGPVKLRGDTLVKPARSIAYHLRAEIQGGKPASADVNVTVTIPLPPAPLAPPKISLTVDPPSISPGGSATLKWAAPDATSVTLSGHGAVSPESSLIVSPPETTSYVLNAAGPGGTSRREVTLHVQPRPAAPKIVTFSASRDRIQAGESSTLTWQVTGADRVRINGVVKSESGSESVSPAQSAAYLLVATGPGGAVQQTQEIAVIPRPAPEAQSGCIVWTGNLPGGADLAISGVRASPGGIAGGLPQANLRQVAAFRAEQESFSFLVKAPAATLNLQSPAVTHCQGLRIEFWCAKYAAPMLSVKQLPSSSNNWTLILHNDGGSLGSVYIEW